jgi:hypothetical protein
MKVTQYLSLFIVITLLNSCIDAPSEIGSGFFSDGNLDVINIDTVTLEVSTVQFDSVPTSAPARFLVGSHNDTDLGKISSRSFYQVAPASVLALDEDFTSYTKAVLTLVYDGYSFYDTTVQVTYHVHRLTQEIELDESYLYNNSSFAYDPAPLGSVTFTPRPNRSDTLEIPLSDDLGKEIIRLAHESAEEVSSAESFLEYFYGVVIIAEDSDDGPILGFSPNSEIRVYYMDKSQTPGEEKYISVSSDSYLKFNQIKADRSFTNLSALLPQRYHLSSTQTNKKAYLQSGAGLSIRVQMPYLREILRENKNMIVSDAVLEFIPVSADEERNTPLPSSLLMTAVNFRNDSYGSFSNGATLIEDVYLERDTRYVVNVKDFVLQQLAIEEFNENALLFTLGDQDIQSTVNRLYIGDQKNDHQMKLKIYCLTFESKN